MPDSRDGVLITLEGIDGSGKSTIASRLAGEVQASGINVLLTREPGGTALGERVRSLVLDVGQERLRAETEALLFTASRAQLVADVILPALEEGRVVISDRFCDSTLAYQWGGRGLDRVALEGMQKLALQGVRPEVTLLFDISPGIALRRRHSEGDRVNRLDSESLAFYERVRDAYLTLASEDPTRWKVIDASQSVDHVWDDIVVALNDTKIKRVKLSPD